MSWSQLVYLKYDELDVKMLECMPNYVLKYLLGKTLPEYVTFVNLRT